jgi:hypothetical protein
MSVHGVAGGADRIGYPIGLRPAQAEADRPAGSSDPSASGSPGAPGVLHPSRAAASQRASVVGPSSSSTEGGVPSTPPPGTDPELWAVLTTEERAYYARVQSLGPLVYGPGNGSVAAAPELAARGGRIDVRV